LGDLVHLIILLNPREDDQVPQGNPHDRVLDSLKQRLRRYLERRGDWGVFSDLMVHWARRPSPSPRSRISGRIRKAVLTGRLP